MDEKKTKKPELAKSIAIAAAALIAVRLFGPLETLLGFAVYYLIVKLGTKSDPDAKWPHIVGALVGVVIAFLSAVLLGLYLIPKLY